MKLPQNRQELIKVLALAVIGVAVLLYVVVNLVIKPLISQQRLDALGADKIVELLAKADSDVHAMALSGDEYRRLESEISAAVSNDIIQPVLGSYLLSVRDHVEQTAHRADFKLTGIQEIGLQVLPVAADAIIRTFRSYGIQVIGTASYAQLRTFLKELESSNPYLSITEITVTGRADEPLVHGLSVRIEWPVMASASIPTLPEGTK